jgi:hypothetical protein
MHPSIVGAAHGRDNGFTGLARPYTQAETQAKKSPDVPGLETRCAVMRRSG